MYSSEIINFFYTQLRSVTFHVQLVYLIRMCNIHIYIYMYVFDYVQIGNYILCGEYSMYSADIIAYTGQGPRQDELCFISEKGFLLFWTPRRPRPSLLAASLYPLSLSLSLYIYIYTYGEAN